jgi:hypothetical protein
MHVHKLRAMGQLRSGRGRVSDGCLRIEFLNYKLPLSVTVYAMTL